MLMVDKAHTKDAKNEVATKKKITVGLIASWFFGVLFLFSGISVIATSIVWGIIIILSSLLIIPYSSNLIGNKLNFEISTGIKWILVILIFVGLTLSAAGDISRSTSDSLENQASPAQNSGSGTTTTQSQTQTQVSQKQYTQETFSQVNGVLGPNSDYTDLNKDRYFTNNLSGKYVTWSGTVVDVDTSVFNSLKLYVQHRPRGQYEFTSDYDVIITVDKADYDALAELKKGQSVTYEGRFSSYSQLFGLVIYMDNGRLK
jgi:hypothetical protein